MPNNYSPERHMKRILSLLDFLTVSLFLENISRPNRSLRHFVTDVKNIPSIYSREPIRFG